MPADFDKCQAEGGKIRTINPKPGKYLHICVDKNGKTRAGEVKTNENSNNKPMKPRY